MDESAILNPAPIAFFDVTSFYIQRLETHVDGENISKDNVRSHLHPNFNEDRNSYGVILADADGNLKGTVSYQKQSEGPDERSRFSGSVAGTYGPVSSFGIIYRYTKDVEKDLLDINHENSYHQIVLGASHAITPNVTFGAVIIDPFQTKKEDTQAIFGGQVLFKDIISFMLDVGGNYQRDLAETFLMRAAIQLNFFSDLYLRAGTSQDKGIGERSNGVGIGWLSPKLMVDFAIKNARPLNSDSPALSGPYASFYNPYPRKEISFSMSYRF